MPLTAKGKKVLNEMQAYYSKGTGSAKKGTSVFYASANKGKIKGVEGKRKKRGKA